MVVVIFNVDWDTTERSMGQRILEIRGVDEQLKRLSANSATATG
jgi:hypothetical protein